LSDGDEIVRVDPEKYLIGLVSWNLKDKKLSLCSHK